jgi:MSHA pilin protein MshC
MSLRNNTQVGFTLVELVLVIVLLAILSAIALPRFFGRSAFDERVFFDDTLNALRYTQKIAVATGCNTRFSISNNSYALIRDDSCDSGNFSSNLTLANPVSPDTAYTGSQANISLSASYANTTFNALGEADRNNLILVGARRISVVAATGFSYDSTP